jgi:hypothetical protein
MDERDEERAADLVSLKNMLSRVQEFTAGDGFGNRIGWCCLRQVSTCEDGGFCFVLNFGGEDRADRGQGKFDAILNKITRD